MMASPSFLSAIFVIAVINLTNCIENENVLERRSKDAVNNFSNIRDKRLQNALFGQNESKSKGKVKELKLDHKQWNQPFSTVKRFVANTNEKPSVPFLNKTLNTKDVIFERLDLPVIPEQFISVYSKTKTNNKETQFHLKKDANVHRRRSVFYVLWKLLRQGQLYSDGEDSISSLDHTQESIIPRLVNGTALVISSCDVSIHHASLSGSNTVLSIFLDHSSAEECVSRILKKNLANIFVCLMDDTEVIQNVFKSRNVQYYDFIFVEELERLTQGLLPQEVEDIGKRILSATRMLLFSFNFEDERTLHIFKSSWGEPINLMDNICARLEDGECKTEVFMGTGRMWMPLHASIKVYNTSIESAVCSEKGLPIETLLSYNLTSHSKKILFHSLLVSDLDLSQENNLHVNGYGVSKPHCQPLESQLSNENHSLNINSKFFEKAQGTPHPTASLSILNSFDIIDGRPVEEEIVITKGYRELGQEELKKTSLNSRVSSTKIDNTKKHELKGTKQMGILSRSIEKVNIVGDEPAREIVINSELPQPLEEGKKKEKSFVIKTLMESMRGEKDDPLPSPNTPSTDGMDGERLKQISRNDTDAARKLFLDETRYKSILEALTPDLEGLIKSDNSVSGLVSGGCHVTMLSAKLSLNHPSVNLVTLDTDKNKKCSEKFGAILDSAGVSNSFLMRDDLSPSVLYQMSHTPQLFDFQILDSAIFSWMPRTGNAFSDFFARSLAMSKVTFVEVPNWQTLKSTVHLFQRHDDSVNLNLGSFQDFLEAALSSTNSKLFKAVDISKRLNGDTESMQLWRVELQSFEREIFTTCNNGTTPPSKLTYNRPTSRITAGRERMAPQALQWKGLNLKMLLSLQLTSEHRRRLFENYLKVPLHEDMCSSQLVWSKGKLHHVQEVSMRDPDLLQLQLLTKLIDSQISQRIFSFMDYNSPRKYIGTSLAVKHPRSTFILPEESKAIAGRKAVEVEKSGVNNCLALHLPITQQFSNNLMKSPDILRYQYIDLVRLILTASNDGKRDAFQTMVGELLASGLTNFVVIPSSQIVSLAVTTIFPGVIDPQPHLISNAHPFFKNMERDLLIHAADTSHRAIRLHSSLQTPFLLPSSSEHVWSPWMVNTVRILHLQQQVDHHFQFEIDHHERKYTQHIQRTSPRQQPSVYLVRQEDGYRIHYGNVSAISLIALLRMGMLPSTRERLYSLFLQLPLHEDMAPWNIVFQGGQLAYIDQDTRDKTFDKFVPLAYQIMSVLINYERTVNDFEHCGERADTQYHFGQVASCVSSKFQGPCPDSRQPVPCGDMTCQPTYIHCLRALQDRMKQTSGALWQEERSGKPVDKRKEWEFDGDGSS